MKLNLTANFGGIFVITLPLRSQVFSSVCRIRWYTASGICISWHSDRSEKENTNIKYVKVMKARFTNIL